MTNNHKTEDRRVKRTKKVLRECLFSLLENKSIDEITVKELTVAADVNRSTFYFYYKDINDMMMQIQDEIFTVFEETVISPHAQFVTVEDFTEYCSRFLVFCKEYEKICKFVISNDPNNNLAKKIRASLARHVPDSAKVFPETDPRRYLTGFAVSAFWEAVIQWMYDGMKISPEEMAKFMANAYFYGGRTLLMSFNK
ncbi:MAG: TetR family transcriptional regulator C-terminal domain-containing protein [Clostridia bacterium]|nr:TetR family transcriptional regulator C-terminal domain-containing protein [Clostridia bacterium]